MVDYYEIGFACMEQGKHFGKKLKQNNGQDNSEIHDYEGGKNILHVGGTMEDRNFFFTKGETCRSWLSLHLEENNDGGKNIFHAEETMEDRFSYIMRSLFYMKQETCYRAVYLCHNQLLIFLSISFSCYASLVLIHYFLPSSSSLVLIISCYSLYLPLSI